MEDNEHNRKNLEKIGRALFGKHWVGPLAKAANLNQRTMSRMASGKKEVFFGWLHRILPEIDIQIDSRKKDIEYLESLRDSINSKTDSDV